MEEPMTQDRFPLAYSTLGCPDWSFEHAAEQAAKHGYAALEVRLYNGDIIPADLNQSERNKIRQVLAQNKIGIIGLGASTRFAFPDAAERQANVDQLRQYIELAADLEVPLVRTFGSPGQITISMQDAISYAADALNAVAPDAERHGVSVGLETHDAFCKGVDVAAALAQVASQSIGAIWDVHHPFRMGEDIETTWRVLGSRIKHVHIKDGVRRADGSWQLVLLGKGEVPCRAVVELLHREGYNGYITAEWEKKWHPDIEEPEIALPQHAETLRAWFAELPVATQ
jgi:sugar phosphate isomerase/epimerase